MINTIVCTQCEKDFCLTANGANCSDGTFVCEKCLKELYDLSEEQHEN